MIKWLLETYVGQGHEGPETTPTRLLATQVPVHLEVR